MKFILEEKNRQIEMLRQGETQRETMANDLKQLFLEERKQSNQEMQEFLKGFKNQSNETAQRLA